MTLARQSLPSRCGGPEAPSVLPPPVGRTARPIRYRHDRANRMQEALFELRCGPLKLYGSRWRGYRRGVGFTAKTIDALEARGLIDRWETYGRYRQFQVTLKAQALNPAIGD